MSKRLVFIDYIRGVAILGVFLFHGLTVDDRLLFSGWTRDFSSSYKNLLLPLNLGWLGVAVFFVVSGFCIHISFQQQARSWRGFFIRRFFRLFPPYLVALLFFSFALPYSRLRFGSDELAGLNFVNHLFMVHNLHPGTVWGINSSFWSVGVEVQLYLLYPVLIWVASRYGWRRSLWLAGACELLIGAGKAFGQGDVGHLGHTPLGFWLSWALGASLAEDYLQNRPFFLARIPTSIFVVLVLVCFLVRDLFPFIFLAAALATTHVMGRLLAREQNGALNIPRWLEPLRQLGLYSYSLYLLHQPLMYAIRANVMQFVEVEKHPFVQYVVSMSTMVFIFPISFLFYKVFEQPSIALGKRVLRALEDDPKKMAPIKVA